MASPSDADFNPAPDERPPEEEALLWAAFVQGRLPSMRARLFSFYADFARNIARRHYRERSRSGIELAELLQLAYAGLLEAIDRFDPGVGTPFRPFAIYRISGSVRDGIVHMSEMHEQKSWLHRARRERLKSLSDPAGEPRQPPIEALAEIALGLALGFMLEGTGLFADDGAVAGASAAVATAYDSLAWKETLARLYAEVAALPERERTILHEHYLNGMNFDQLASLLEISKGRVSQLHRAALGMLRKRMREQGHFRVTR
jgi:RNA polymerase sigma factor for flagellar operon FliA